MSIAETKDGIILKVFVKPNSQSFKVLFDCHEIIIYSTEEPVKGKVNKQIIRELTRLFHAKVELISGSTSKEKQLIIFGINKNQVEQILNQLQ